MSRGTVATCRIGSRSPAAKDETPMSREVFAYGPEGARYHRETTYTDDHRDK